MAVLHRALLTWFLIAVFLIMLTLRLDEKTDWNWFIVFVPMWIFDCKIILFIVFRIITHCKEGSNRTFNSVYGKLWYLFAVFLKVTFQVFLCVRLQYSVEIRWFLLMIPLWLLFAMMCGEVFTKLIRRSNML